MSGPNHPRGTTNRNQRGGSSARRVRKLFLLDKFGDGYTAPCTYCQVELDYGTITADRITPGCQGGTYRRENIRPACLRCNSLEGSLLRDRRRAALQSC